MNLLTRLCVCAFATSLSLGCKVRSNAVTKLQHDDEQPTRNQGEWQWIDTTEDEYFSTVVPYLGLPSRDAFIAPGGDAGAPEHELVTRMQFWLDAIDQEIRLRTPEAVAHVPKPRAVVVRDADANAFVSPVPVCLNVSVRLNPELAITADNTIPFVSYSTGGILAPEGDAPHCVSRQFPPEYWQQVVTWFNSNEESCHMELGADEAGQPQFVVGKNCPMDPQLEGVAKADAAVLITTANWITINTGLIAQFSAPDREWMVIPTLAHELGHYYRSHMTTFPREYNFFYKLDADNLDHRPQADFRLKERGAKVFQSAKLVEMHAVPQQKIASALYLPATQIIRRFCRRTTTQCKQECRQLDDLLTSGKLSDSLGDFPEDAVPAPSFGMYKQYESLFTRCAKRIPIGDPAPTGGFSPNTIATEIRRAELDRVLSPLPAGANLQTIFKQLSSNVVEHTRNAKAAIASAERDLLVRYTVEQEADEFGLEQFAKLGFEPADWLEADFVFNRTGDDDQDQVDPPGDFSVAKCEALYRAGWKDERGAPVVPPRGGFYEPHPSSCFRSYNIDREIRAHHYTRISRPPPLSPGSSWSDLAALAKAQVAGTEDVGSLENVVAGGAATKKKMRHFFVGCPALR